LLPIILQKATVVDYKSVIQPSPSGFRLFSTLAVNDVANASDPILMVSLQAAASLLNPFLNLGD
jgi:hypothetical protein